MTLRHCVFCASNESCKDAIEKAIRAYKNQVFDWESGADIHGYYPPYKFEVDPDDGGNTSIWLVYDGDKRTEDYHLNEFIRECINFVAYNK